MRLGGDFTAPFPLLALPALPRGFREDEMMNMWIL